jgi:two-component system sensor histidine kinase ChiS
LETPADPILLVDDHDDTRRMLIELLSLAGYRVAAARDGREALAVLDQVRPCIVLLDLGLPDISGVELCRLLRAREELGRVPIYAMSGFYHLRAEAFAAGCDGYLLKPVRQGELRQLLSEHCGLDVA